MLFLVRTLTVVQSIFSVIAGLDVELLFMLLSDCVMGWK